MKTQYWTVDKDDPDVELLMRAGDIIKNGGLVAFPTETVYGLGANGLDERAVAAIYRAKGRPSDNPLILHIADSIEVEKLAKNVPDSAYQLMKKYWPGPLTLLFERLPAVPDIVTGGLATVAIRLPNSPIACQLIKYAGVPIAAPSANLSGKPSPTNAQDVLSDLDGKIDLIIDGGSCEIGLESTVIDCLGKIPVILRPGGITYEMLAADLGEVIMDPGLANSTVVQPRAPGMKYRHYAPAATVLIIQADSNRRVAIIKEQLDKMAQQDLKVGLLVSAETASQLNFIAEKTLVKTFISRVNPYDLAEQLFFLLRWFDARKTDYILIESVDEVGIGTAVMNRLKKAASDRVLF